MTTTSALSSARTGRAFLYVLYLDGPTGANRTWVLNTDYFKIELKSPDESATAPEQNGLSSANGVDTNNDGKIDYLYAGDRRGNLWKVDVSSATPSSWAAAMEPRQRQNRSLLPRPLPRHYCNKSRRSRLYGHPKGGYLVLFGTGSYLNRPTSFPFNTNSSYGIWDKNDGTMASVVPIARSKLQKQRP